MSSFTSKWSASTMAKLRFPHGPRSGGLPSRDPPHGITWWWAVGKHSYNGPRGTYPGGHLIVQILNLKSPVLLSSFPSNRDCIGMMPSFGMPSLANPNKALLRPMYSKTNENKVGLGHLQLSTSQREVWPAHLAQVLARRRQLQSTGVATTFGGRRLKSLTVVR